MNWFSKAKPTPLSPCLTFGTVMALILILSFACRPNTITWLITAIIIHPFNRQSLFPSRTHIFPKIRENQPAFTHSDSSTSVSFVTRIFRIKATLFRGLPNVINSVFRFVMSASSRNLFTLQTAARFCVTKLYARIRHKNRLSTVAIKAPNLSAIWFNSNLRNCNQTIKTNTSLHKLSVTLPIQVFKVKP
jgi:hypothetical protein